MLWGAVGHPAPLQQCFLRSHGLVRTCSSVRAAFQQHMAWKVKQDMHVAKLAWLNFELRLMLWSCRSNRASLSENSETSHLAEMDAVKHASASGCKVVQQINCNNRQGNAVVYAIIDQIPQRVAQTLPAFLDLSTSQAMRECSSIARSLGPCSSHWSCALPFSKENCMHTHSLQVTLRSAQTLRDGISWKCSCMTDNLLHNTA